MTITATDQRGDSEDVDVILTVTHVNEDPGWTDNPADLSYEENDTDVVATYLATDPEMGVVSYSLLATTGADADLNLLSIHNLDGTLSFNSPPDFEDPQDVGENNTYQVTVQAEVVEANPIPPHDPEELPHMIMQAVTVTVTNVNEAPVFSRTLEILQISENADDPDKEPPAASTYLYLLNRGAGKPAANLPATPNLDLGVPVVAVDDDSSSTFAIGGYTEGTSIIDRIDGLTYELSGTGAGPFHIVPATGQILTSEKLDYEIQDEYDVTITATDTTDLSDSIDLTIVVIDVDEQPVPKVLRITAGDSSPDYAENGTDAVGEYTVTAYGGEVANPRWALEGTDAGSFMLDGTGMSRMLKFRSSPDHEAPADADGDNTYEVTIRVTDPSDTAIFGTFGVTVDVTNVEELGALGGPTSLSVDEGATDVLGTYMITGGPATVRIAVIREGADADQFVVAVNAAGDGLDLSFSSAPDYEAPTDADGDNTYEVTVKATAGGEETMVAVTVTVDDVNELGTLGGSDTASIDEGDTDVGTYTLTGGTMDDTATWAVSGDDAGALTITGGVLTFNDAPDFEAPADADGDNTYMVTVMASAGGEEEMMAVAITVDNVDELGALGGSDTASINEGATDVGTYMVSGGTMDATATWAVSGDDAGALTITGGMLKFSSAPDYESPMGGADNDSNTYMVTVMASAGGEEEMMAVAITVDDVDELGALGGSETASINEGATDVGTYMVSGGTMDATATWAVSGDDAGALTITGGMLKFSSAPDYESPMGGADNDSNTYMVTVMASAGGEEEMMAVAITVDDVDELGALGGSETASINEGATDVGTYMVSGGTMDATATWNVEGADADHFTITGGMLKFSSAPDYEKPNGRRRQRLQHLHGHRHGLGRRRRGDDGSRHHRRRRGRTRCAGRIGNCQHQRGRHGCGHLHGLGRHHGRHGHLECGRR